MDGIVKSPPLAEIGSRYGKTASQMALRWLTQRGIVAITKSTLREHMQQNLDIFDFTLTAEDMEQITSTTYSL